MLRFKFEVILKKFWKFHRKFYLKRGEIFVTGFSLQIIVWIEKFKVRKYSTQWDLLNGMIYVEIKWNRTKWWKKQNGSRKFINCDTKSQEQKSQLTKEFFGLQFGSSSPDFPSSSCWFLQGEFASHPWAFQPNPKVVQSEYNIQEVEESLSSLNLDWSKYPNFSWSWELFFFLS